ncbi:MAG TPA: ribokinase [Planctomycetota bacterium]|jgi:ribokinase|nr:ribokinase [Planctomycetota bacterium]OQC22274.1 MAG: Ribokinase [Planctomycetes bacterium ADurb.Bin069]HNS00157.1 ribokinase [Planctomycetota bacterium]HNU25891.1 ribokinase [Planctomycetota bacterium]HOE29275.1 ribokinase [Planctomycetota bacterium]
MRTPIVVAGSLNMDFVVQMQALPTPGQTLRGRDFQLLPGGKGANQACAVGKLGGRGLMLGRVGGDVFGEQLKASLAAAGVDTGRVARTAGEATGVALIFVESGGQNMIVIAAGANDRFMPADIEAAGDCFTPGGYVLLQLESPQETVEAAAAFARGRGMTVILDPAPARPLSRALLGNVDILTPNETEALLLLGRPPGEVALAEAPRLAAALRAQGPRCVILKLGDKGAWYSGGTAEGHVPAFEVEAVDATAAGDTFNGALAVALSEGAALAAAVRFANCAAAISVTRLGAQASVPSRAEVDAMLRA